MKKLLIALAAAFMMLPAFMTNANARGVKYQGDASVGYAFGTGTANFDRFNITTTHGVRINQYLFAGAGSGFNFYSSDGSHATFMPIYLSLKGYYPIADNLNLFGSLDFGKGFRVDDNRYDNDSGLYFYPHVGVEFPIADRFALDFTVGYHHQAVSAEKITVNFDAVAFKVSFRW